MQLRAPVARHVPARTGDRLIRGVRERRRKLGPVDELRRPVVVKPVLTGFEALDHRMSRGVVVSGRMLAGRIVATADVSAFCASPEMQPPIAGLKTFDTTSTARNGGRIDAGYARFIAHRG